MAKRESIFTGDWHECLQEHYKDVVRRDDKLTENTLTGVLHDVGFREEELRELKLQATMRAEDMHDDFVPALELGEEAAQDAPTAFAGVDVPAEPAEEPMADQVVAEEETDDEAEEAEDETPDEVDPDGPQQMSMF